jgi:glycosyltransferase involved in cell wall biosynthesis
LQKKDLELYIGAYDIENLRQYFPKAANVFSIKFKNRSSVLRLLYDIPAALKKYSITYAHFQYIVPPVKNCKFIVTTHDVLFNEYPQEFSFWYRLSKNFLYRVAAKKADLLTTDSEYSNRSIQKYLGIRAEKINVIRLGINTLFFQPYNKQHAADAVKHKYGFDKYILFVSRREPRKNHTLLLKAYLELKLYQLGYYLVFVGHESIKTPSFDLLYNTQPQNIKSFIIFNDKAGDEELLNLYRGAAVFVYPSKAEGFGLPPLEAGALQVPVLCSNSAALSDFTFFKENHIDPGNYDVFKNKLLNILVSKPDESFLRCIAETIRGTYCWEHTAEKFYQLIKADAATL